MLGELQMLENVDEYMNRIGPIGEAYLSHRLLNKRAKTSLRIENLRQIASRLTAEDADSDNTDAYPQYIKRLTSILASTCSLPMKSILWDNGVLPALPTEAVKYEYMTAAVHMGKLSTVRELSAQPRMLRFNNTTLSNPWLAAVRAENTAIVDLLLQQGSLDGESMTWNLHAMLQAASRAGSVKIVEHLLASEFNPGLGHKREHPHFENFHNALATPSVEVFDILMRYKENTLKNSMKQYSEKSARFAEMMAPLIEAQSAPLTKAELAPLLYEAAANGWENMASRLLDMGAPTDGIAYGGGSDGRQPLLAACTSGSDGAVRILLQRHAKITGLEMEAAAKRGRIGTVRVLLEHGEDSNRGKTPPIVSAVKLEHMAMFHLLLEHGAKLDEAGRMAVDRARKKGLDSMLVLLGQHGVSVEPKPSAEN